MIFFFSDDELPSAQLQQSLSEDFFQSQSSVARVNNESDNILFDKDNINDQSVIDNQVEFGKDVTPEMKTPNEIDSNSDKISVICETQPYDDVSI